MALTERGKAVVDGKVKPRQPQDWAFRKAVAYELFFAWQDGSPAVKRSLERVMHNVGMDFADGEWSFVTENGRLYIR